MFRYLMLFLLLILPPVAAATYSIEAYYSSDVCTESDVYQVHASEELSCAAEVCLSDVNSNAVNFTSIGCSTDYVASMISTMNSSSYVIAMRFSDTNCTSFDYGYGTTELDMCVENKYTGGYSVISLDGSASIAYFSDSSCSTSYAVMTADSLAVENHECSSDNYIWYTNIDFQNHSDSSGSPYPGTSFNSSSPYPGTSFNSSSDDPDENRVNPRNIHRPESSEPAGGSVNVVVIVSTIFSIVVLGLLGVIVVLYRRLKKQPVETRSGLWDDDTITATRIPRNKIKFKKLLCRGAFGEVYAGVFNRQPVAIKMLLPATRSNLQHVNEFLTEAKMTATMDHPNIVYFVGVAWDSLSDLCVVLEFMDGGDLRTLLNKYEAECRQVGVDRQKATIAIHICHALTYLHSLDSPVIHRDLKSRNVLLNQFMTAKLTDFGISRERLDRTMTAGVGTSLWMAPEVMLGNKYDIKADIFSFGVVLSELDVHTMPYARVRQKCRDEEGREIGDATLLQRVSSGEAHVEFSYMSPGSIVNLGRACVSVDPQDRPTAAEVLYRLQVILAQELISEHL